MCDAKRNLGGFEIEDDKRRMMVSEVCSSHRMQVGLDGRKTWKSLTVAM